jgi:hypothetical protein
MCDDEIRALLEEVLVARYLVKVACHLQIRNISAGLQR